MNAAAIHHANLRPLYLQLSQAIGGEVDFSSAGVALFASDASNYRQVPLGIVFPQSEDDIKTTFKLCRAHKVPVLMRGAGTSQNGQTVNQAVILDCSRFMNQVLAIDAESKTAVIQPGLVCDALKTKAELDGLTFGPDPATHSRCTLGGMIGNNSCGPHSMLAGKTVENILELKVLTTAGDIFTVGPTTETELAEIISANDNRSEIYRQLKTIRDKYADEIRQRYPTIKRRVSGYNLDQLLPENGFNVARSLVGSEGTCVSVLSAKVKLIENPKFKHLFVLGFENIFEAGDSVPEIMPFSPIAMEGLDWNIIGGLNDRNLKQREVALLPEGRAWLLIELAANTLIELDHLCADFELSMTDKPEVTGIKSVTDATEINDIWSIREQGASATALALNPGDTDPVVGWEDTAVDPLQLGDYLRELYKLVDSYGYQTSLYGHFGDGCIHARMTFDTRSTEGIAKWRRFSKEIAELVVKYNGSLSGEHGDGQAKAEFLPVMYGETLMQAFREFKQAWDPNRMMNPGKLIDAYRMDENLRFGPDYTTPVFTSVLNFTEDAGGFGRSTERCIGMGKCRAQTGAMCPSYQATGEERFSTRGRAHLLHELLRGELIEDGFYNTDIATSLEHCLSCKACKTECPTQVDIAAYKSEFMAQHYKTKRRPLNHYFFGKAGDWLPLLSKAPWLFNSLQKGITGKFLKAILGIQQQKILPALSKTPFRQWIKNNSTLEQADFYITGNGQPVVLWIDSVNNAYRSEVLTTAVSLLNRCGFSVHIAKQHFCCGRPLYEYGFLDKAQQQLLSILEDFYHHLPADCKVIVLEPSCLSVFKDELLRLFPNDGRATDLATRTMTMADFLVEHSIKPQRKFAKGIVHLHCHSKSGHSTEREWLQHCFEEVIEPESGCCGMAGVYGLKESTGPTGDKLYQRSLAKAVNDTDTTTRVVTNGFSCRKQIEDNSDHKAWHPVEIMDACLRNEG